MVQETFGRNNKTLVNTFWHKTETEAVSQKLQVLLLRLLLFFPFRFVYLLPQTKREQWSILQPQILKEIVLAIRLLNF